jgi:hypothetical protein
MDRGRIRPANSNSKRIDNNNNNSYNQLSSPPEEMSTNAVAAAISAADAIVSNFRELYERVNLLERKVSQLEGETTKGQEKEGQL